jgi:hypothetical protein
MTTQAIPLTLNNVIQMAVYLSPPAAPRNTFNKGLIIGGTSNIPADERVRVYTGAQSLLLDGFTLTDPEYLAAQLYFSQIPTPTYLYVGRSDQTVSKLDEVIPSEENEGAGYAVGDTITINQFGGSGGSLKVTSVGVGGAVAGLAVKSVGTGYQIDENITTSTDGEGTGLQVDIVGLRPETATEALMACRGANSEWYAAYYIGAEKEDIKAMAAYVEAVETSTLLIYDTYDTDARAGADGNIFDTLKGLNYNRSMGLYISTPYAGAAVLGRAMGLNTGLANSAFIMDFKNLVGVTAENHVIAGQGPISENDISKIISDNGNVYVRRGGFYDWFMDGRMASGRWFDQMVNIDMLTNAIQLNVADLFNSTPKVPFSDQGATQIMHACARACDEAVARGYLTAGTWKGTQAVLNLQPDDPMPRGYVIQSTKAVDISTANRSERKWQSIYVACHEANGIQGVLIGVYVD